MKASSLRAHIRTQRLDALDPEGLPFYSYSISTSRFGIGNESGSFKTPLGNFVIAAAIGADAEPGMIFRSRVSTGQIGSPNEPEDLVETRILWLEGRDPSNANTYQRYIYLHGTNQEHHIGAPSSHGCIRMLNEDIVELFELVHVGTPITIQDF